MARKKKPLYDRLTPGGLNTRLGNLILSQVPYPDPRGLKLTRAAGMRTYGPGARFNKSHPFRIADVRAKKSQTVGHLSRARVKRILAAGFYWKIGGGKHRMSKVMRIPYLYYDPVLKKNARAALIIAWEGGGGGC